ncbi:hypothetical protein ACVWZV_001921 [Bradyrhizobium sp. GM5.1]
MDRRKFMVRCLSLPLLAQVGATRAQAGLTKIIFPFGGRRGRRHAVPADRAGDGAGTAADHRGREPHRR